MAPLQKRALYGLVFGIVWAAAIVITFIAAGDIDKFQASAAFRITLDFIWIAGLVIYLVMFANITTDPSKFDERDRAIMDRANRAQWIAIIVALVAWVIGLNEAYRIEGRMPVDMLYPLLISALVVSSVAQTAGILIGYWKMDRYAKNK